MTEAELESALKLSTAWDFEAVRNTAVSRLESLSLGASRAIQIAHLYSVDHWIAPEIERLSLRPESLSLEEAEQIGLETAIEICAHRDLFAQFKLESLEEQLSDDALISARLRISENVKKQRAKVAASASVENAVLELGSTNSEKDEVKGSSTASIASSDTGDSFINVEHQEEAMNRAAIEERIASLRAQLEVLDADEERRREEENLEAEARRLR